jgi:hypothetical protein
MNRANEEMVMLLPRQDGTQLHAERSTSNPDTLQMEGKLEIHILQKEILDDFENL